MCLSGDAVAWEVLVMRYKRLIYSIPVRFNFAPPDASDIFQATCVAWIEHLPELEDETKVMSWLITTTTRQCIRLQAERIKEASLAQPIDDAEELSQVLDPKQDVEVLRASLEARQAIREALEELSPSCRSLILLLYIEGATYSEIAETVKITKGNIGPTRARCLEKLRIALQRKGIQK